MGSSEPVSCLLVIKQNQSETVEVLSDLLNCTEKAFSKEAKKKKKTGESSLQKERDGIVSGLSKTEDGSSALVKHSALVVA